MSAAHYTPIPLFDTQASVEALYHAMQEDGKAALTTWLSHCFATTPLPPYAIDNYQVALQFLYSYRGSADTFNSYRRELEKFLQWSWFIHHASITSHKRLDIEAFIEFCIKPYKRWMGVKMVSRFLPKDGGKAPNPQWRPFVVKVSKKDFQAGRTPEKANYQLSQKGLRVLFAILSSFYQFMIQEGLTESNPVAHIRQKSKFLQTQATAPMIRRLSDTQWRTVMDQAQALAKQSGEHQRTLFVMQALYHMYLRISELTARKAHTPTMGDFFRDHDNNWWFKVFGKGKKTRQIAVGTVMLDALKQWREHLGLSPLPSPDDTTPLIPNQRDGQPITSSRSIANWVQGCFDQAIDTLALTESEEATLLRTATAHWLRHTGISDDVKIRPREHVRDDAGHSSGAITDRYIDVELQERAKSAQRK